MSENIKFQKVVVYGMVIKMCGDDIRRHIIRRMLYRCKRVDLFAKRKYNDSSRMLSGTSADSRTPLYDTVNLTFSFTLSVFFVIILYITECGLVRQCTYRSGTECLTRTKDNLCILMRITLIISEKLKSISGSLFPFESKECLKRNVKSIFYKLLSTYRTYTVRHIPSAASGKFPDFLRIKITVMTFLAVIMWT